jgi:predicted PurR-regulated permease PerM
MKAAISGAERPSALFYVLLAAALLIFIQTFALLSPILLSLLLTLLISLALNPVIARMRAWTGGRKGAVGLLALTVVGVTGLTGWAFSVPMKDSVTKLADQLPEYWERLQKPLIKLEQQAVSSGRRGGVSPNPPPQLPKQPWPMRNQNQSQNWNRQRDRFARG